MRLLASLKPMAVEDLRSGRTQLRLASLAVFVAAAYTVGAVVGFALKLPHATPSVMWPPNAILTSVLLLTRPAWWPVALLSALPPHVLLESGAGFPPALALGLFATNCSEAVLGAAGLRWLSDAPTRFDSLRRVGVFVAAVVFAAPFLTSFLDAGVVSSLGQEAFWPVWRSRLLSNVLAALTVVPAFVTIATSGLAWLRTAPRVHQAEAALLGASMLFVGVLLFRPPAAHEPMAAALAAGVKIAWFLPLLVWAALRFGPGGTSVSLLATTLFLIAAAMRTDGPFRGLPPPDTTAALQLFLIPMSVPLLTAAALVEERRQNENALRASEAMKSAILTSLTKGVVVLDREGRIIAVNESWKRMAAESVPTPATETGADYLEYYRARAASGSRWAADAAAGIQEVVLGTTRSFWIEHVCPGQDGERAVVIRAVPLNRVEGGAVVTHLDVSDQRRAEREAQRARAELAHVARVSTVSALTASIAHQLNQPLTGILANAQAASRFLGAHSPDLDEVRASLRDIVEDDRRASEVIVRMRELLRHDDGSRAEVDVNRLVDDIARLLSSDAIIRDVSLVLDLDPHAAVVRGDRVQLEQVVLNVIVNALDAVADRPDSDRRVVVRSRTNHDFVEVAIADTGAGFNGAQDRAFDPFYTTKPGGMGLGLSIAKSIVQAHAGVIQAANNLEGGATVHFRLPLANHDAE